MPQASQRVAKKASKCKAKAPTKPAPAIHALVDMSSDAFGKIFTFSAALKYAWIPVKLPVGSKASFM